MRSISIAKLLRLNMLDKLLVNCLVRTGQKVLKFLYISVYN